MCANVAKLAGWMQGLLALPERLSALTSECE